MIRKLDLKDIETANQVLKLQMASYQVEAEIIGFFEIPPLNDTIDSLKKCKEIFYGYYDDGILAGIISFKIIKNVLDIHRVAVHPSFFRLGIGNRLLNYVEGLNSNINKIVVTTGKKNLPAVNLYLKHKYQRTRDIKIIDDIFLTEFEKKI